MSSRRTILLVEDEELVRNYLKHELEQGSWIVTPVGSGDHALAQLESTKFDAILCDLDLKRGPSGLDVLARMPPANQGTPFVILTAHGSTGRCREAFLLGAADFLEKPIGRALFLATLDHAVADVVDGVGLPIESNSTADVLDLLYDEARAAFVRRAIEIMERRHTEFGLTIATVAADVGLSADYLGRLFRERLGRSPLQHLHHVRIGRAAELLTNSHLSIYEIARDCGYQRNSEFSSWFRRLRGSTPSGLRAL